MDNDELDEVRAQSLQTRADFDTFGHAATARARQMASSSHGDRPGLPNAVPLELIMPVPDSIGALSLFHATSPLTPCFAGHSSCNDGVYKFTYGLSINVVSSLTCCVAIPCRHQALAKDGLAPGQRCRAGGKIPHAGVKVGTHGKPWRQKRGTSQPAPQG